MIILSNKLEYYDARYTIIAYCDNVHTESLKLILIRTVYFGMWVTSQTLLITILFYEDIVDGKFQYHARQTAEHFQAQ